MAAELPETFEAKQAHQRSSLKWILSKAFNNQVPDNLKDPFYRDHEGLDHIKPQIVVGLGNASLYCQTLSNLYSDPNYQSLNHWSILQTMTRKGITIAESSDVQLTETALIQTNPLRINSHMLVIDALMVLYAKEVATADRVATAIARISGGQLQRDKFHFESGLLVWISHACASLKRRINADLEADVDGSQFNRLQSPNMPPIREYRDLCDGVCLAFLISYYCPRILPWPSVRVNHLPTVEDSIHNVLLVSNFSQKHLPYTVFHMAPSDITYMRGSMKQNLVALLADLFNLFEIHPTKCVNYPGMEQQVADASAIASNEHGIVHRRGLTVQPVCPIPDLRGDDIDSPGASASTLNRQPFQVNRSASASSMRRVTPPTSAHMQQQMPPQYHHPQQQHTQQYHDSHDAAFDEGFVVHRGRAIPTLTSAMHEPLQPARLRQTKEKTNTDSKADERGDHMQTAGRPSNWEDARRPSYSGRRSRRNSFTEDSQLTIENFGGSQDQINMIGHSTQLERKYSNSTLSHLTEPTVALRSSVADARGTLQLGYNEPGVSDAGAGGSHQDSEKQDRDTEKKSLRRQASIGNVSLDQLKHSSGGGGDSGAALTEAGRGGSTSSSSAMAADEADAQQQAGSARKKTSFSALPNTTTWQQQQLIYQQVDNNADDDEPLVDMSKLSGIRMKLEEKRRHIELEKRRLEIQFSKQQQKVGKAAFLQAINKGNRVRNPSGGTNSNNSTVTSSPDTETTVDRCAADPNEPSNSATPLDYQTELKKTPESETSDIEHYQENIALMNSSLQDIQMDINRLSNQQSQMHAQHIQANQLLQAQQIANLISQFGSQRNIPVEHLSSAAAASPQAASAEAAAALPARFGGSTPHLPQSHGQMHSPASAYHMQQHQQQQQQQPSPLATGQHSYNIHDQYSMQHQPSPPPPQQQQPQTMHRNQYPVHQQQQHQYSSQHDIHQQSMQHHHQQQQHQQHYAPQYLSNNEPNPYQTYRVEQSPASTMHANHHHQQQQHHSHQPDPESVQFFLHDSGPAAVSAAQPVPARRTWAQQATSSTASNNNNHHSNSNTPPSQAQALPLDINAWSQNSPKPDHRTWRSSTQYLADGSSPQQQRQQQQPQHPQSGGFMLHQQQQPHQNGGQQQQQHFHQSSPQVNRSDLHRSFNNLNAADSPQHHRVHRQISQIIGGGGGQSPSGAENNGQRSPYQVQHNSSNGHRVQTPQQQTPPQPPKPSAIDDMAPQSISFIGDDADVVDRVAEQQQLPIVQAPPRSAQRRSHYMEVSSQVPLSGEPNEHELDLGRLNITSGKLTYRIPSPTRPSLNLNSFDDPNEEPSSSNTNSASATQDDANIDQKGFYISFDNAQPKRPKPPLRTKRSPKKERSVDQQQQSSDEKTAAGGSGGDQTSTSSGSSSRTSVLYGNANHDEDHMKSISAKHFQVNQQQQQQQSSAPAERRSVSSLHMAESSMHQQQQQPQLEQRHFDDLTNRRLVSQLQPQTHANHQLDNAGRAKENKLIIDDAAAANLDPESVDEMERKKEKIMLLSLQRRQQQEEAKARKEVDAMQRREREQSKQEERERKREQQQARRNAILEQHKFKKAIEEAEQKGLTIDRNDLMMMKQQLAMSAAAAGMASGGGGGPGGAAGGPPSSTKMRPNRVIRPRPKTIHVESGDMGGADGGGRDGHGAGAGGLAAARNKKGSNTNLTGVGQLSSNSMRRDYYRGSQDSLAIRESPDEYPSTSSTPIGRRGSYKTSREPTVERGRTISRISVAKGSNLNFRGRKSNSLMNLCADTDSGLGRATPPRRAPSPGMGPSGRHLPSPSGPGSLPPGFMNKRRIYDDGSSDISSAASSIMDYSGPKLYKQPATKSNRGIILNAVEYCVFPGVVNRDAKMKVLDKIARSEAKHFLVLFRDAGCQFRALYGYWPENESVHKLYGTGPNTVDEFMFDKFFKYNSGGKCFSQVHTKHLTVTIDAFTIHNSLWQGKKVAMPSKRDMTLVI